MYAIVILVGGKGTRVSSISNGKSKQEIEISPNKKIIDYQIKELKYLKKKFFFISSKNNKTLNNYLNLKYKKKINFELIEENKPLGTSGALKYLEELKYIFFLIIDGDLIFKNDFKKLISFHVKNRSECTLVVHPNNHPYDSDCVDIDHNFKIKKLLLKPHGKNQIIKNLCMSGIRILNKNKIKIIKKNKFQDFSKDLLVKLFKNNNRIYAYNTREYIKDAGTLDRIKQVKKDIKSIKYKCGNINNQIPAIFLDKDGVINYQNNKIHYQDTNKFLKGARSSIKKINQSGYLSVLITNQPAVAKGYISIKKLEHDLDNLNYQLGLAGAYLDRIYYCPHHPEKGFQGENVKFKKLCNCRKPNNGMIVRAIKELNIDVKRSYMIGDNYTDYLAAKKSKVRFIAVGKNKNINNVINKKNIIDAVNYIFNKN